MYKSRLETLPASLKTCIRCAVLSLSLFLFCFLLADFFYGPWSGSFLRSFTTQWNKVRGSKCPYFALKNELSTLSSLRYVEMKLKKEELFSQLSSSRFNFFFSGETYSSFGNMYVDQLKRYPLTADAIYSGCVYSTRNAENNGP